MNLKNKNMFYSFSEELNMLYIGALGISDENEHLQIFRQVQPILQEAIITISDIIKQRMEATEEEQENSNWTRRFDAYMTISTQFHLYVYTRYWQFNGNGPSVPQNLTESYKNIFTFPDTSPYWNLSSIYEDHNMFKNLTQDFINTLDTQVRQFIFVYCYEHGMNFGYF